MKAKPNDSLCRERLWLFANQRDPHGGNTDDAHYDAHEGTTLPASWRCTAYSTNTDPDQDRGAGQYENRSIRGVHSALSFSGVAGRLKVKGANKTVP